MEWDCSNLIVFVYPVYASFKAIRTNSKDDDTQWLTYWVIYALVSVIESVGIITALIPYYSMIKVVGLVLCFLPQVQVRWKSWLLFVGCKTHLWEGPLSIPSCCRWWCMWLICSPRSVIKGNWFRLVSVCFDQCQCTIAWCILRLALHSYLESWFHLSIVRFSVWRMFTMNLNNKGSWYASIYAGNRFKWLCEESESFLLFCVYESESRNSGYEISNRENCSLTLWFTSLIRILSSWIFLQVI